MVARLLASLLLAMAFAGSAVAQDRIRAASNEPASAVPADSITHQRFNVGVGQVAFTVTAGTLPLDDTKGERQASIFYVAYVRDGAPHDTRPVTFVFNGGPGASSAYLHLAALGPKVIAFGKEGQMPAQPVQLIDNPDSWLDLSDLVFIDPVGTGYSRAAGSGDDAAKKFYGVREDLQTFSAFINRYLNSTGRFASPKYLVGESYGGFRAARLPELLSRERGITVNGVFMISPVLEFSLLDGSELEPLPDVLRLPSYAATVLERSGTLSPQALEEVERFALGPYLAALVATPRAPEALTAAIAQVARYTGLPEELIARHGGRLPTGVFIKEVRRADKQLVSRYDGSVAGLDPYPDSNAARHDPIYDGLLPVLASGLHDYLRDTLGVKTEQPYRIANGEIVRQWNWRGGGGGGYGGYAGASDELREALAANPQLNVIIAHGMTDLVAPYMTSRFVVERLPSSLTDGRVVVRLYPGGHMMYLRAASRAALHADAARLYQPPPQ
jgi:carboxypeptidase C (cathepsin A)